jgi:hypothetical protein
MKQQFVAAPRYTILQETEETYLQRVLIFVLLSNDLMTPHIQGRN